LEGLEMMSKMEVSENTKGVLFVSLTSLSWGILPFILIAILPYSSLSTVVWFRFTFAFACLFFWFLAFNPKRIKKSFPLIILPLIAGVMLAINYYTYFRGLQLTTASNTEVLIQGAPLTFTLLGIFLFKEKLRRLQLLGILVATFGFAVFYRNQLAGLIGSTYQYHLGNFFILIAVLSWAIYASFNKISVRELSPQNVNFIIFGISAILFTPFCDFSVFFRLNQTGWILMLLLGLNTILAYGAIGEAIKRISATKVSIIVTLNPIITLLITAVGNHFDIPWIPKQNIDWDGYLGALFVIFGAIIVVSQKQKARLKIEL